MADIRVLIVDDSPTVRRIFEMGLTRAQGIEVVGTAPDPYVARDLIVKLSPDVITLDIEMPRMDGLTFLGKLMKHFPLPVVVCSTLTSEGSQKALKALADGAVEVLEKNLAEDRLNDLMLELVMKVRAASKARVRPRTSAPRVAEHPVPVTHSAGGSTSHLLAIGSSTGGIEALNAILPQLPADTPGTVVVQHIPPGFTKSLAERLNQVCQVEVREAQGGEILKPGLVLIAPGDRHLLIKKEGGNFKTVLKDGPRVGRHKPSVDVLFKTVAKAAGDQAVGVILTGMGHDGAAGMAEMKTAGSYNIAQNEESCVVYGMPRTVVENGDHHEVTALDRIPAAICKAFNGVKVG